MKPRILFVDDHEDTRQLIEFGLKNLGYEVAVAASPSEGIRLARGEQFDLYLLDGRFAEGSGVELCSAIREFDPETPIIFFTGEHSSRLMEGADCPAQGVVMKPDFDELKERITSALRPAT